MSVPFAITHLRTPRGIGPILEGLAREVLRDQPEDIPKYAAQYFDALLTQREDSRMDPAEWAAKQEDKYNNNAFKAAGAIPEKDPETEVTISKENSFEDQTEDESETLNLSTTQPNVSEEVDLTASAEEYEEKHDMTEKHVISLERGISEEETGNMLPAVDVRPDDESGAEEEKDPTITTFDHVDRAANGKDSSSASDHDMPQSELEPTDLSSFTAIEKVDVCSQELGTAEDEGGDQQATAAVDEEIVDSEGVKKTEQVEAFPYSGLADVDVCATELGATERLTDGATAEDEDDSSKPQPEETVVQSSLSQSETPECNQHEAEDQEEPAKEEEATETKASPGRINESLAHIKGGLHINDIPQEDSLVEISFEDVPEDQQIKEVEEKQSEEEGSVEDLQNKILEIQQEEESKEVTVVSTDQNISSTQDQDELEMMGVEKAVISEGGGMESQHEAFHTMKEKVDTITNDYNVNDSDDDEKRKGVKTSSSHQPTSEADEEDEADQNEHSEKMREGEFHQKSEEETKSNNPDDKEDETTDTVGGDKEDIHAEGYSEVEDHSPQVNVSTAATESETLEASAQLPLEENEEGQRTPESQPEDAVVEKERRSEAEDLVEEGEIDSEIQKKSDAMCEEGSIILAESADRPAASHQGEGRPLEKDSTEPEGKSGDKDECSRPQEEEDIMDIPLDDPEANRAAAKIQAGFRGHMTRKKMKPEDKAEAEQVSSAGDVLNSSKGGHRDRRIGGSRERRHIRARAVTPLF